jgi:hypothetical protein
MMRAVTQCEGTAEFIELRLYCRAKTGLSDWKGRMGRDSKSAGSLRLKPRRGEEMQTPVAGGRVQINQAGVEIAAHTELAGGGKGHQSGAFPWRCRNGTAGRDNRGALPARAAAPALGV